MIKHQLMTSVGFVRSVSLSEDVQELVHQMLEPDVKERATVEQVQESVWLAVCRLSIYFLCLNSTLKLQSHNALEHLECGLMAKV